MNRIRLRLFFLVLLLGAVVSTRAQIDLRSPFLPEAVASTLPKYAEPVELRGIVRLPDGLLFCFFDREKKKSLGWIGLNDPANGIVVKSFDADTDIAMVEVRGSLFRLALVTGKVAASGQSVAADKKGETMVVAGEAPSTSGVRLPVRSTPLSPEEKARIRAVVAAHNKADQEYQKVNREVVAAEVLKEQARND